MIVFQSICKKLINLERKLKKKSFLKGKEKASNNIKLSSTTWNTDETYTQFNHT